MTTHRRFVATRGCGRIALALAVLGSVPSAAAPSAALGPEAEAPARLVCGRTVAGSLDAGAEQRFVFHALPGDVIAIDAVETAGDRAMTQLRVVGPGLRVNTCTGRIDPASQFVRPRRLEGGDYVLGVRECFAGPLEFSLTFNVVSQSPRNCGVGVRCGAVHAARLTAPGEVDSFQIRANRGDVVYLDLEDTTVRGGLEVRVFGPDGVPLGDQRTAGCTANVRFQVEESGVQTVLVNACWGKQTGDYRVAWHDGACPTLVQPTPTPTRTEEPIPRSCIGDCDGDGLVTVNEILFLLSLSLGEAAGECMAGDLDGSGSVTVEEVVAAVDKALNGCGA